MLATHETLEGVGSAMEREAWVTVLMEGTKSFVAVHPEPEPFGYGLDGEGSEFLNVESMHKGCKGLQVSGFRFQVSK